METTPLNGVVLFYTLSLTNVKVFEINVNGLALTFAFTTFILLLFNCY